MDLLPEPIEFEWDAGNIRKSLDTHGMSNQETEEAFARGALIVPDAKHSVYEDRHILFGKTAGGVLLYIVFTLRAQKVRVISSRRASARERKWYEEKIKEAANI